MRAEGLPWDAAIVHAGVGLAAGGASRLICRAACLPLLTGHGHGHGHALHLLRLALVLPGRGLWAPVAAVRAHMRPLPILHARLGSFECYPWQAEDAKLDCNGSMAYSAAQHAGRYNRGWRDP